MFLRLRSKLLVWHSCRWTNQSLPCHLCVLNPYQIMFVAFYSSLLDPFTLSFDSLVLAFEWNLKLATRVAIGTAICRDRKSRLLSGKIVQFSQKSFEFHKEMMKCIALNNMLKVKTVFCNYVHKFENFDSRYVMLHAIKLCLNFVIPNTIVSW